VERLADLAATIMSELYLVLQGYKTPDLMCFSILGCMVMPVLIVGLSWWLRQHDAATRARVKVEMMEDMIARGMTVNNMGVSLASMGVVIIVMVMIIIGLLVLFSPG
jgi:hypothetical protein